MSLRLPGSIVEEIRREGERAYPAECCGVLGGRLDGAGAKEVVSATPALNRRTDDPHRYLISPDDHRRVESALRAEGLEILGYYHSHPDHPAVPSAFDAEHAWPWYSYVILRVDRGRAADVASWVLDDAGRSMHSESLEVLSEV
ncbi:MAG TPA: M67 family metallopeptidase [Gemmatimonadales bacterium]|jgi:proteasome lid subunit RPN8/RPN11